MADLYFKGIGRAERFGNCLSWGSPPTAYARDVYSTIADLVGAR